MAVGSTVTACRLSSNGSNVSLSETTDWAGISHKSDALQYIGFSKKEGTVFTPDHVGADKFMGICDEDNFERE